MKVKDVKDIFYFSKIINHKSEINKIVEVPLIDICKYLFDINIPTTMTNANAKKWNNSAYITIDYDLLSQENKEIVDKLFSYYPNNFKFGHFSTRHEHNEVHITLPITEETEIKTIQKFFWNITRLFKIQDVQSFIDSDTNLKNVYNVSDFLYRYLVFQRGELYQKEFKEDQEIEDFLISMGYQKVKTSEINGGNNIYNGHCNNLWINNSIDSNWISDTQIYGAIIENREQLFKGKPIKKENLNYAELLRVLNQISLKYYNERFFFNPEDERFYLNQELLEKHKRYLESKKEDIFESGKE